MVEVSTRPNKIIEWEDTIQRSRWEDVKTSIEPNPIQQEGMQEVGLYNGILATYDALLSRLPKNPIIQKIWSIAGGKLPKLEDLDKLRVYGGSTQLKNPDHAKDSPITEDESSTNRGFLKFWKNHKEKFYSKYLAPDSVRARRRLLINELRTLAKDDNWDQASDDVIRRYAEIDAIGYQLVNNQNVITVETPELGKVSSIVTKVISPREPKEGEIPSSEKPLVIAATGYGNDTAGGAPLIAEIALEGQDVMHISYPDSYHATEMSREFVQLVEKSPGLTAHAEYFKACVREIIKQNPGRKIELWGQSTGSLVWATALSDPEFSQLIDGAVLIHPAGAVDVSNQKTEFVKEGGNVASATPDRMALYKFVIGATDQDISPQHIRNTYPAMLAESVAENAFGTGYRGRVWKRVMAETKLGQIAYQSMRLKDNKRVLRINATEDNTTRSAELAQGSNEVSVNYPGTHADTNLFPDKVVPLAMAEKRKIYSV